MNKINKNEILKSLKADMKEAERLQREWFIKREEWSSQTEGAPYGNEVDGKSKIVSKDIKKQREWMIPSITDPFLSTSDVIKCNPVTYEDAKAARQNELLLNTQFCRKFNRYNFIMKATKVLVTEGSVVIQTGWDYEEEEVEAEVEVISVDENGVEFVDTEISLQTNVIRNQPTAVVCRNEDIFIDPTCMDDMDKCQFVIHRYESSLNALKQDGRYENLDKVEAAQYNLTNDPQYLREDQSYFEFKDKPRKKFVVHEYWGNYDIDGDGIAEPIVCAWVGNTLIRLESNPYPDKKPPFIIVPFSAVPFQMFGEALAETIGDNQKVKTAITRGMIDNMAKSNNAVVATRKGALDPVNRKKFLKGENFEFNGTPGDFWQGGYNQLPSSAFDMLNLQNNEIESQTGVKSFSGGISGNALGSTATGARGALDATATRRLNLVRNMSENMIKPIMRKWMAYNAEFLEEEEVIRITNDEYVPIRRDDLAGKIDIDISISTSEDNAAKSQELSFLLQTVGPNEDPAIRREIMAQIMDLMRMPEQAKKIRDYQPPVDPVQQKMQELQIAKLEAEIEKIKADAANKLASSVENEADRDEKLAQAELKRAQTRKLMSEADNLDLDFLKKDEMIDEQTANERDQMQYDRKMQEKQFDRMHTLEVMQRQIDNRDTNIGVK
ncbi:MAG: hypothetical protein ACMV1B_09140 [Prevotella sp.]